MNYVYCALWFVIAILVFVRFRKESKISYLISGFFIFMGAWWLVNELTPINLMDGYYVWIFRGVALIFLTIVLIVYFKQKNKSDK